jgi:hypothetical protein
MKPTLKQLQTQLAGAQALVAYGVLKNTCAC